MRPLTEKETETLFNKLASYMGSSLKNLIAPLDNGPEPDRYVFRMIKDRVYYVRLSVANLATSIARDKLLSIGICLGMLLRAQIQPHVPSQALRTYRLTTHPFPQYRKVHKDWQVPSARNRSSRPQRARKIQDLGQGMSDFKPAIRSMRVRKRKHVQWDRHANREKIVQPNGEMPFLYGGNIVKAHVGRWSDDCPEHQGVIVYAMDDKPLGFGVTARSTAEARRLDPTGVVCFRQSDAGEYLRDEDTLFATNS